MTQLIPGLIFCIIAAAVLLIYLRSRILFVIVVEQGKAVVKSGDPPEAFVRDVQRICDFWKLSSGRLHATRNGKRIKINLSRGLPRQHRQAFQNAWNYPI